MLRMSLFVCALFLPALSFAVTFTNSSVYCSATSIATDGSFECKDIVFKSTLANGVHSVDLNALVKAQAHHVSRVNQGVGICLLLGYKNFVSERVEASYYDLENTPSIIAQGPYVSFNEKSEVVAVNKIAYSIVNSIVCR